MSAYSTRPGAGNGQALPEETYRDKFPPDWSPGLRGIAYSQTRAERLLWAKAACRDLAPKKNEFCHEGQPTAEVTARLINEYSQNGPRAGRLTLADARRIVEEWMSQGDRRQGGDV